MVYVSGHHLISMDVVIAANALFCILKLRDFAVIFDLLDNFAAVFELLLVRQNILYNNCQPLLLVFERPRT